MSVMVLRSFEPVVGHLKFQDAESAAQTSLGQESFRRSSWNITKALTKRSEETCPV